MHRFSRTAGPIRHFVPSGGISAFGPATPETVTFKDGSVEFAVQFDFAKTGPRGNVLEYEGDYKKKKDQSETFLPDGKGDTLHLQSGWAA
jgi:hypothetical protein